MDETIQVCKLGKNAKGDCRRFSDSAAFGIIRDGFSDTEEMAMEDEDIGIVCTMGDLVSLKCLNSSAQEIRMVRSAPESCVNIQGEITEATDGTPMVHSPHSKFWNF